MIQLVIALAIIVIWNAGLSIRLLGIVQSLRARIANPVPDWPSTVLAPGMPLPSPLADVTPDVALVAILPIEPTKVLAAITTLEFYSEWRSINVVGFYTKIPDWLELARYTRENLVTFNRVDHETVAALGLVGMPATFLVQGGKIRTAFVGFNNPELLDRYMGPEILELTRPEVGKRST